MSKMVKSIEITFENLDYADIPAEYFGEFYIGGIHTTVEKLALNAILQRSKADYIQFELLKQVGSMLPELKQDLSYTPDDQSSLLRRIANRRDITSLELHYCDGSTDRFYVLWEDAESETRNKLQQAKIDDNGHLLVTIQQANMTELQGVR